MAKLHLEFYKGSGARQDQIPVNRDIAAYIAENAEAAGSAQSAGVAGSEDFSAVLARDERWEVFYHLSDMRGSLLNWYEFKEGAKVLEIGAEFGALTGMLCDRAASVCAIEYGKFKAGALAQRYAHRDNLDIYAGELKDMELPRDFDYIILAGCMERQCGGSTDPADYVRWLEGIRRMLKPGGIILAAAENRYGLRYFCGERERYTGQPFGGISGYSAPHKGYSFSRQELDQIFADAGLEKRKFYYPLPDYKLPQMIYTDAYLPRKDLGERLLFYHTDHGPLLMPEQHLYADVIDNQVFPFFANSFLIEAGGAGAELGTAVFAAVTTDRGAKHGLATSIHSGEKVRKKALFPAGDPAVRTVYDNIKALEARGLPVVPHSLKAMGKSFAVEMPFVDEPTCSDLLRKLAAEGSKDLFEQIFARLWEDILNSSEEAASSENALPEAKGDAAPAASSFGPILRRCYVDMVPFNCFFTEGRLSYFDQEFVRENYPARYPMWRALMYTYAFVPEAETLVPLEEMKERYGLTGLWSIFRKEEDRFVADNRRYEVYGGFYKWTGIDSGRMERNRALLSAQQ